MTKELEWRRCQKPTSLDSIKIVGGIFGVKFPGKYIDVVLNCHSGIVIPNTVYVDGFRDVVLTDFMSFEPEAGLYIVDAYHDIKDRLVEYIYPFVYEASGDCLCFDYRGGKDQPKIVLWDHEEALDDIENGIFPVCNSFEELLELLKRG